jgi:hypothetical protein
MVLNVEYLPTDKFGGDKKANMCISALYFRFNYMSTLKEQLCSVKIAVS